MTTVFINGITGKMGSLIENLLQINPLYDCIGGANTTHSMKQQIKALKPDIIIDVTRSDIVMQHMLWLIEQRIPLLVGTSGFSMEDKQKIKQWTQQNQTTCWLIPNFSIGAILMMEFAKIASHFYHNAEITERHHTRKVDSPSQTALDTKNLMSQNKTSVSINSIRDDIHQAEQCVTFKSISDELIIEHKNFEYTSYQTGITLCLKRITSMTGFHEGINLTHLQEYSTDTIIVTK